ncbi:uncharacterized protein [Montipora capricornis]|uniref:uncharacterized protein n=1 Tax=Montipora capricornis TaxID=246305 RepID=UPI0035F16476
MDHSLSSEEDGSQHSTAQSDEESVSLLQLQRAIADDLSNYQCFVKPFHSVDKERQEQSKVENTPTVRVGQQEINSTGNEGGGNERKETSTEQTGQVLGMDLAGRIKAYEYDILRLKKMLAEKMTEVEEITAEKGELESSVQNALHKLWTKEEELHAQRESSLEREKTLLNSLRQESARSEELELQVQFLAKQNDALQEQLYRLEQQLSEVKIVTEQRKRELENKLPELEGNQESLKRMTAKLMGQIADVVSAQTKQTFRTVDLSSCTSVEETNSEMSGSGKFSESLKESNEDDLSQDGEMINLKELFYRQRKETKDLMSSLRDIWRKINVDSKMHVNEWLVRKEPKVLLDDIYEAYCREKSKIVELEEQNIRQLKNLQDIEEDLCTTEGRIQRIWVSLSLNEEREEKISSTWKNGSPCAEETENALGNIERVLAKGRSILRENRDLKQLNASQEEKINDLQGRIEKARRKESEFAKEVEVRNAKFEELRLSSKKEIEDKDVEIEVLKEQLQELEKKEEQKKMSNGLSDKEKNGTDEILKRRERELVAYKKKSQKKDMALRDEVRDLQEALERTKRDKDDLDEHCILLKEETEKAEARFNSTTEEATSLKEALDQAKKKEEKLFLVTKELYDEFQIKRQENASLETAMVTLYEKVKCFEIEIQTTNQERQVDKKNLKNAKETEQYLQSSLQEAMKELFELKAKKEGKMPAENGHQSLTNQRNDHKGDLMNRLHEVETFINNAMKKSVQDLDEYAVQFGELCEVNNLLKKEVDQYNKTSTTLEKENNRLKMLLQATKDDLLEEMKAKQELEVLLARSTDKSESTLSELNESVEHSTSSQVHELPLASSSDHTMKGTKKTGKSKRKLIAKAISRRLRSSSSSITSSRKEKRKDGESVERVHDNPGRKEALEHERQLRNTVMTLQRDKEELAQRVESLRDELQKAKRRLKSYDHLNDSIRDDACRHVREMTEMNKFLEAIHGRIERAYNLITNDIQGLVEASEVKDMQLQNLEQSLEQFEKENAELLRQIPILKEKLKDAATLKEAALDEGRQLRVSLKTVLEAKEKCLLPSQPPLVINNLNTDVILPQMGKDEVRSILKEVLQEVEYSTSVEMNRMKQSLAEQTVELQSTREQNEYLKPLVDAGVHEQLQKAEEKISHVKEQLKVCEERQKVLRGEAINDKVTANKEIQNLYERYAELKITLRSKEEVLNRYHDMEEALMTENTQLQEEMDAAKQRFSADNLLLMQNAEAKRTIKGWKRKFQRLEEHFEKENNHLREENTWLHNQLAEESSFCAELQGCKAKLKDDLAKAEERLKVLRRKLEERQETLAGFEERRVALETKLSCVQKVNNELQDELSKERFEADRNLLEMRNEFESTVKELKKHQREGNNMVTKVFLLENAKEKLENELKDKERKMAISFKSFTEDRSRLTERVRDLRISLEEEVKRRLDLEEKMQQIVKISVTQKGRIRRQGSTFKAEHNRLQKALEDKAFPNLSFKLSPENKESAEQATQNDMNE